MPNSSHLPASSHHTSLALIQGLLPTALLSIPCIHMHSRVHKKLFHHYKIESLSCTPIPWLTPIVLHSRPCSLPLSFFLKKQFPQVWPSHLNTPSHTQPWTPWLAQANIATNLLRNTTWFLDSGASHHVTTDLSNLALHNSYDGTNDIMIGAGFGLNISYTSAISLNYHSLPFIYSI